MCDKEGTKERVLKWKKMQGGWIMCALLKHMGTNIIFLQDRVVQKTNTEKLFTHISTLCTSSPPLSSTSQRAGQSLLCHFSCPIILLPREKQSVLDLKEKGSCLYHVQLSSRQNASTKVWREKCCHWGVAPFIRRLSRMDIMGWEGWGGMLLGGEEAEGMNMFPHPFIALYSSTNRSQHAFVSALLLPFFPSPLERANTFSFCQRSPLLCLCVRTRTSAYMRGLGRVLLVASSPVWPYLINTTRPCGCRMAASLKCLNSNLLYNEKLYDGMTHIIVILVFSSCPWQLQLILSAVSWTCLDDVVAAFFYFWLKSKRPGRIRMGKLPVQRCAS